TCWRDRLGRRVVRGSPAEISPTGVKRPNGGSASPPARCTAHVYLLRRCDETHIDADVSTSRYTGMRLGASYSLTCSLPVRAVTRQSIERIGSPVWEMRG